MASTGALSSLGVGSGTLTYDVIDKLKAADESAKVNPIKVRLNKTQEKIKELSSITTNVALLKGSANDLSGGALMDKRLTNVVGDSLTATAVNGTDIQNIKVDVKQLAQNDVYQSIKYDSETADINTSGDDQKIKLNINGVQKEIDIKKDATLTDLKNAINDSAMGVTASIINTGSDDKPYQLILRGDDTGKDYNIKLDFSAIDDIGLNATKYQSKKYDSDSDSVTDSDTSIKFTINGTDYSMDVSANTSVKDFVDNINSDDNMKDAGVSASYNSDTGRIEFKLKEIGDVSIDEGDLNTSINSETDFTNSNRLQTAVNSEFTFNGASITRSSNKVDDLVVGLTMNFEKTGESTINISRDDDGIVKSIKDFFSGYNSLMSKLDSDTSYDVDTKKAAIFQGESTIKGISGKLNADIFNYYGSIEKQASDLNGTLYNQKVSVTADDFGISLSGLGNVQFDENKFKDMLKQHGDATSDFVSKIFDKLKSDLDGLVTGPNSSLESLNSRYLKDQKSFQAEIKSTQESLNKRYDIMASRFAAYDSIINSYNVMSQSLDMEIKALTNSK